MKVMRILVIAALVVGVSAITVGALALAGVGRDDPGRAAASIGAPRGGYGPGGDSRAWGPREGWMGHALGRGWPRGAMGLNDELRGLMEEHRQELQEWWEQYGGDSAGDEAQNALRELRTEHHEEMLDLLRQQEDQDGVNEGSQDSGDTGSGGLDSL